MSDFLLEIDALQKHYPLPRRLGQSHQPVIRAVDGISFKVPKGRTFGLIGESGCGKTTTARMLLRLEEPSGGQILFDGQPVQAARGPALRQYRRHVQAVFQDPFSSLNPRRTISDAIAEPLIANAVMPRSDIPGRIKVLLDVVGLSARSGELYPHEFSGGQRQRVAIARGLALQPQLLILDEPVSALDVSVRAQILNLLQDLQDAFGLTYILISHDLDIVAHMCSSIAVMFLGRIVERGTVEEIVRAPQHPYTQALFSSVLSPHPDRQKQRIRLFGTLPSPINPPDGCNFSTRCPVATPKCGLFDPDLVRTAAGSEAACHYVTVPPARAVSG